MNRSELLDKLAMELAEWPSVDCHSAHRDFGTPDDCLWEFSQYGWSLLIVLEIGERIIKQDWLQRREELINCPPDSEAPGWATHKEHTSGGVWLWIHVDSNGEHLKYCVASRGKIPAGHDWRTTLTRINRDDSTSTPEEEAEFRRIQARIDSKKPHESDARILDAQLNEAVNSVNVSGVKHRISTGYPDAQLEHDISTFREVYKIAEEECAQAYSKPNANSILNAAAQHMQDRAATYDKPEGERSMAATVAAFNAVTGDGVMNTEERGWLFMQLLKAVRSQQGDYRADSYEDGSAYCALAGEAAAKERAK